MFSTFTELEEISRIFSYFNLEGILVRIEGMLHTSCEKKFFWFMLSRLGQQRLSMKQSWTGMRWVLRGIWGFTLKDNKKNMDVWQLLELEPGSLSAKRSRLWWFEHVERKEDADWFKWRMKMEIEGTRKTWWDYVKGDMESSACPMRMLRRCCCSIHVSFDPSLCCYDTPITVFERFGWHTHWRSHVWMVWSASAQTQDDILVF